jgi:hypothetical protein
MSVGLLDSGYDNYLLVPVCLSSLYAIVINAVETAPFITGGIGAVAKEGLLP